MKCIFVHFSDQRVYSARKQCDASRFEQKTEKLNHVHKSSTVKQLALYVLVYSKTFL